jgi:hypothetical protein
MQLFQFLTWSVFAIVVGVSNMPHPSRSSAEHFLSSPLLRSEIARKTPLRVWQCNHRAMQGDHRAMQGDQRAMQASRLGQQKGSRFPSSSYSRRAAVFTVAYSNWI